jgi:hypothetical protein
MKLNQGYAELAHPLLMWVLFAATMLLACAPKQHVVSYCDLPHAECEPLAEQSPEVQAQLVEQAWCCPGGEPCTPVEFLSSCPIEDIAIYCEYGRSIPSTSESGASGFECFG